MVQSSFLSDHGSGRCVWHTTPALDLYAYAGLEKTAPHSPTVGTVPFGYGNPLYNNTGCNIETRPAATCKATLRRFAVYRRVL